MTEFTLLDAGRIEKTQVTRQGDRLAISREALEAALGWELKPEGFCQCARRSLGKEDAM